MPDKYDAVKRFKEVAKRSREVGRIDTGKPRSSWQTRSDDIRAGKDVEVEHARRTRPGATQIIARDRYGKPRDVNLPIETASTEVRERLRKRRN